MGGIGDSFGDFVLIGVILQLKKCIALLNLHAASNIYAMATFGQISVCEKRQLILIFHCNDVKIETWEAVECV